MAKILQRYTAVNAAKIFENLYGFLCVRQILHLTCLTIISNPHPANDFYRTLDTTANYKTQTDAVARRVMAEVGEGATGGYLTETILQMAVRLVQVSSESGDRMDFPLIIRKLWEDRDSFSTLCAHGLLPGCPLLLFASYTLGPKEGESQREFCMMLKDLYLRHYLVGSNRDRQVIEETCKDVLSRCGQDGRAVNSFVSSQDSRAVSQAHAGLLNAFRRKLSNAQAPSVGIAGYLSELVLEVVGSDPSATVEELAGAAHCALEYFWLFLARPKEISVEDQISTVFAGSCRAYSSLSGPLMLDHPLWGLTKKCVLPGCLQDLMSLALLVGYYS
ncbi:hypothetical protein FS749_002051 [Ceratobasidium sp. UAMH 11750]|nr:hypothetical protein FS749_002051 [Ceratobasidium sp. UAMH 11750]